MKKNIFISYIQGIQDNAHGQDYKRITKYFVPEFITAVVLYSVPLLIDARFIACINTTAYATLGLTNTFLHFIIKVAEGLSVGTIVLVGAANGQNNTNKVGSYLFASFITTLLFGGAISLLLFLGAPAVYDWYHVSVHMKALGVPFLQVRAIGIFFTFVYFALIGFLRGIKNTKVPMYIFLAGSFVFVLCDYIFIFGKCGFSAMSLQGSALAMVVQYVFMTAVAFAYIVFNKSMRHYIKAIIFSKSIWEYSRKIVYMSWPIMVGKGTLALTYLWLSRCIAPMGDNAIASFAVVKDLERFALLPAIAFAQVVTFLSSNYFGKKDFQSVKTTTKKIVLLSSVMVLSILFVCSMYPKTIIMLFDLKGDFTDFASLAFPIISSLAFFDVLQLILAGALRGTGDVKLVMYTRLGMCLLFFLPVTTIISLFGMTNQIVKFVLIYSSLYIGNALMSVVYIRRMRSNRWKNR